VEAVSGAGVQIPQHERTIQPYNINQRTKPENIILICLYQVADVDLFPCSLPPGKLHASLNNKIKTTGFGLIHHHQQ
jgi:hypothetical protein